jgi:hypothetical protein
MKLGFHCYHLLAFLLSAWPGWALTGRVLEASMQEPVPGALVRALGSVSVLTDSNGQFLLQPTSLTSLRQGAAKQWHFDGMAFSPPNEWHQIPFALQILDTQGSTLVLKNYPAGSQTIPLNPFVLRGQHIAFVRFKSQREHVQFRLMRHGFQGPWQAYAKTKNGVSKHPLTKTASLGTLEISRGKLVTQSIAFSDDDENLGDIVLQYPPRSLDTGAKPPYGATMLFDGSTGQIGALIEKAKYWQDWLPTVDANETAKYTAATGTWKLAPDPKSPINAHWTTLQSCCNTLWGYDDLQSKWPHGDAQIHVEFNCMGEYDTTENANASDTFTEKPVGKGYCNSGVYVQSRYELQIYSVTTDTTVKPSDDHNGTGALVGDQIPTVNANRKNGEWQAFDITFRSARYGVTPAPARMSVWWNGKLVHDNLETTAPATGIAPNIHSGEPLNETLYGLKLQSEGRDVRFRNIWIKPLQIQDSQTRFGY